MTFAVEAQQQIIQCRKLLKWTYAYAYYAYNEEEVDADWRKLQSIYEKIAEISSTREGVLRICPEKLKIVWNS